jgi:ribosome-associated protein
VSEPIIVTAEVQIPARAVESRAVRSSGPGGQNVNKVASKIELLVRLDAIEGLSEAARDRLQALSRHRLDAEGRLRITSQATRDQARNREDARERVRRLVLAALVEPQRRHATRPTPGARERRLTVKKQRAAVKRWRTRPEDD